MVLVSLLLLTSKWSALLNRQRREIRHDESSLDGLIVSPVCCLDNCALDTVSYRDGDRRQLRLSRMATDINNDLFSGMSCGVMRRV